MKKMDLKLPEKLNKKDDSKPIKVSLPSEHNLSSICLNDCINWELEATIANLKESEIDKNIQTKYTFTGKSVFFCSKEASILNILNNAYNTYGSFPFLDKDKEVNSFYDYFLKGLSSTNNNQTSDKDNESINNFITFSFPIENDTINNGIIDANFGIKDNLRNIFYIEFDIEESKEKYDGEKEDYSGKNYVINLINNECANREINFSLNSGRFCTIPISELFSAIYVMFSFLLIL